MKVCSDEVIAIIDVRNSHAGIRRPKEYNSKFVGLDTYLTNKHLYQPPVLIVTESPHIEEFKVHGVVDFTSGKTVQARPVNGLTGRNIMANLLGVLSSERILIKDGHYPVILMNALQEQCSEGKDTLELRTRNFIRLWGDKRASLEERLNQLSPCVVLCSCTVGDFRLDNGNSAYGEGRRDIFEKHFEQLLIDECHLKESQNLTPYSFLGTRDLSGLVLDVIDSVYAQHTVPIFKTTHPASWKHRSPNLRRYNRGISYRYEKAAHP